VAASGTNSQISNVTITPGSLTPQATTNWTIDFTATANLPSGSSIYVQTSNCGNPKWPLGGNWALTAGGSSQSGGYSTVGLCDYGSYADLMGLTLTSAIAQNTNVTLTLFDVTNPSAGSYPGSTFYLYTTGDSTPASPGGTLYFGTQVTGVYFAAATRTASQASNWTVDFTATSSLASSSSLTLTAPAGTTFPSSGSSYTVGDLTTSASAAVSATPTTGSGTVTITTPVAIGAGDRVSVSISGMTNPAAGTYPASDFSVGTQSDPVPGLSSVGLAFTSAASTAVSGVSFTSSNDLSLSPSTWTVGLTTTNALSVAQAVYLNGPTGTAFSSIASDYTVSGQVVSAVYGGGGPSVEILLPSSLAAGSQLTVVASNTTNPDPGSYGAGDFSVSTSTDTATVSPPNGLSFLGSANNVSFHSNSPIFGASAVWAVSFTTGPGAPLYVADDDSVDITGPGVFHCTSLPYVNGTPATTPSCSGNSISINVPADIAAGTAVTVTNLAVTNPANPGQPYTPADYSVTTSTDTLPAHPATAMQFTNQSTSVASVSFSASTYVGGAAAAWTYNFTTSASAQNTNVITLTGPSGSIFSSSVTDYTVNGTEPDGVTANGNTAEIQLASSAAPSTGLTVVAAGTQNPAGGLYPESDFTVATDADDLPAYPSGTSPIAFTPVPDGLGSMTVLPGTLAAAASGASLTFTYVAPTGGLQGGEVDITVPSGFTPPSLTPSAPGYVSANSGQVAVQGMVVKVTNLTLPAGGALSIDYGDTSQGGSGASAPTAAGAYTFSTQEMTVAGGSPAPIAKQPSVTITSAAVPSVTITAGTYPLPTGGETTITVAVTNGQGIGVSGATGSLSASSPGLGSGTVTTGADGQFQTTYTAPSTPGPVLLTASIPALGLSALLTLPVISAAGSPGAESNAATSTNGTLTAGGPGSGTPSQLLLASGGNGGAAIVQYGADPEPTAPGGGNVSYFDAGLSAGSTFTSATLEFCGLSGTYQAYWYDVSSGSWTDVSPQAELGTCLFIGPLTASSSPTLGEFTGTPFAIAAPSAPMGGGGAPASPPPALPVVTSITPSSGPAGGGTAVTIVGTGFMGATEVHFGDTAAANVQVLSDGTIVATSPAGSGTVDVTVTGTTGTSAANTQDQFTYVAQGGCSAASAPTFSDVPQGYWAYTAITDMACRSIVTGFPDGTFRPGGAVTRAQFMKMLVLALGLTASSSPLPFTDVPASSWEAPYIAAAVQAHIAQGVSETAFDPAGLITREQMAVLLARSLGLKQTTALTFKDEAQISSWAVQEVAAVVTAGYMQGLPDGTFSPLTTASRAEAAAILDMVVKQASP